MEPRRLRLGLRKSQRGWRAHLGRLAAAGLAIVALSTAVNARASTVLAMDLAALTAAADRIVVAEVLSVVSRWETGRKRIITSVEINVAEAWKGNVPTSRRITVVQPGGQVGDIEMKVHGLPLFREGERTVLFLKGNDRLSAVVGFGEGLRRLTPDASGKGWIVSGSDRTAAVLRGADGRLVPAGPDRAETLADLRAKVRALVTAP
ncbi:MAG TPA: hypothetical protein VGG33_23620 [Polyangia bacterium]